MTATSFRPGQRFDTEDNRWVAAKEFMGTQRVALGPVASHSWLHQPEHLAFQLSRYRAAAALIGNAETVIEFGCGEGIGTAILAKGRLRYWGIDTDEDALRVAIEPFRSDYRVLFSPQSVLAPPGWPDAASEDAVVSLDVIEHLPSEREDDFLRAATRKLRDHGVCVIGTPNAAFDHLASPQSKAGHINTYTHDRLHALMRKHFQIVQSFGMQDTSLHLGHPDARHYLLLAGIGPVR